MVKLEDVFFTNYEGRVEIDGDMILVAAWNEYIDHYDNGGEKIDSNNEEFFENFFANKYDAAWAVSMNDKWDRTDRFVYFSLDAHLVSFTHWDDERSPIDIDKIDISNLINSLKK